MPFSAPLCSGFECYWWILSAFLMAYARALEMAPSILWIMQVSGRLLHGIALVIDEDVVGCDARARLHHTRGNVVSLNLRSGRDGSLSNPLPPT